MVILEGLELVIAHIGEVVGVDGASGEPDDHRARSGIGHIPAHKLQRVFPPWPREPRLNDRPVPIPTHPRPARVGSHHSSICATTIGLALLLLKSVTRLPSASPFCTQIQLRRPTFYTAWDRPEHQPDSCGFKGEFPCRPLAH